MATGCPPPTETRQRLPSMGLRVEAKTISRLSAVQVIPSIGRASEVSCRACPPDAGMTKSSCAWPVNSRLNATHFPLGEDAGRESTRVRSQAGTVSGVDIEQIESAGIRRAVHRPAHEFPAVSGPRDATPTLPDAALGAAIRRHDVNSGRSTGAQIVSCLAWNPATEGDKATIGGPGREHVLLRPEGQLSGFPAFYRLNINMLRAVGGRLPGECNTTAVRSKRRIILGALKRRQGHDIQDGIG